MSAHDIDHAEDHGHQGREETTLEFWEGLYSEQGPRWSGRPNQHLVEVVADLPPGRALDLGCGEGGDAVWLARRGWEVTAVDVSPTALGRLTVQAESEGVSALIDTVALDLAAAFPEIPEGGWDLVSAQFFQSTITLPRTEILRRGAAATSTGGLFLLVEHGEMPAGAHHHDVVFPTVDETLAELALPAEEWTPVRIERTSRKAEAPNGQLADFVDNVVALRRVGTNGVSF